MNIGLVSWKQIPSDFILSETRPLPAPDCFLRVSLRERGGGASNCSLNAGVKIHPWIFSIGVSLSIDQILSHL